VAYAKQGDRMTSNRRLTVIMMADVVDYSRLMEADEVGTLAVLKHRQKTIVEPILRAHGGRIVKLMGDGMLIEFASAVNAVTAAIELHEKFTIANRAAADHRHMMLRIGINLGDVIGEGSDIYGHGVNIAARLETQAPRGGILVSDAVHAHVVGKVGTIFTPAGELQLKNMSTPVRAWSWTGSETTNLAIAPFPRTAARQSIGKPSIAVLPFTNLSDDPKQEFFSAGLKLDLESALSLISGIELLAHSATADFQLTGSVRAASGQIRVTAGLAGTTGARQLWTGRFDGRADDIFTLQEEITRQVAVAMQVKLTSGDYARLWDGQTRSLAAWERCVVANQHHERWSEADNRRARDLLHEALDIDPDYIGAKMLLTKTWWYDARYYLQGADREHALVEAERLAKEVLERVPDAATAMMFLGATAWLRDRHDEAVALCRRATKLSPSDPWTMGFFGLICVYSGDLHEAVAVLERAARLSPQTLTWIDFHTAHARAWLGDVADAQSSLDRYIAANPQDPCGYLMQAIIHGFAGRTDDARRAVAEAVQQQADVDQKQVRRSYRFRDPARMERVIAVLDRAGLPA
jgi:adenylate cyclase